MNAKTDTTIAEPARAAGQASPVAVLGAMIAVTVGLAVTVANPTTAGYLAGAGIAGVGILTANAVRRAVLAMERQARAQETIAKMVVRRVTNPFPFAR